ncbi:unnamed protein product, partial [marine sediment metagenome]
EKLRELLDKTMQDRSFRSFLKSDPKGALATVGVDISNQQVLQYLKQHLNAGDEELLADGQVKKIFAVVSSASIVVAVSTPAFPKGEESDGR